jgi:hypothetical protein
MQQYNLELQIYNNYKNNLSTLKYNINKLNKEINKGWGDMMELINDLSHSNEALKVAPEKYKDETLEEIDRLTKK